MIVKHTANPMNETATTTSTVTVQGILTSDFQQFQDRTSHTFPHRAMGEEIIAENLGHAHKTNEYMDAWGP